MYVPFPFTPHLLIKPCMWIPRWPHRTVQVDNLVQHHCLVSQASVGRNIVSMSMADDVVSNLLSDLLHSLDFSQDDKANRFDLVVINRVFQFYADSLDDCTEWISVLHAAISRFKPQEAKDGGNMSDPDGQAFLLKQGHGPFAKFKERQVQKK